MQNNGLCNNCVKNKACSLPRKFPMFLCEEFDISLIDAEAEAENAEKR